MLTLPPDDNSKYEKNVNDAIENALILREQLKHEEALKKNRKK